MIVRKFVFVVSLVVALFGGFIITSGIGTSIDASIAVQQLSDDIVISSMARESAKYSGGSNIPLGMFVIGIGGIVYSMIPKKKSVKGDTENV